MNLNSTQRVAQRKKQYGREHQNGFSDSVKHESKRVHHRKDFKSVASVAKRDGDGNEVKSL